jgi:hypothetical protein
LRAAVARAVLAVDPDAAVRRREEAQKDPRVRPLARRRRYRRPGRLQPAACRSTGGRPAPDRAGHCFAGSGPHWVPGGIAGPGLSGRSPRPRIRVTGWAQRFRTPPAPRTRLPPTPLIPPGPATRREQPAAGDEAVRAGRSGSGLRST